MAIAISGKQSTLPIGSIQAFGGTTEPEGWKFCNGDSLLRADYAKLFVAIGTAYGTADGTHFNLPNLRGKFLRGVAHGQSSDPDRASRTASATGGNTGDNVGSVQTDAMQGHYHSMPSVVTSNAGALASDQRNAGTTSTNQTTGAVTDGVNGTPRTTSETRPTNVGVEYIIKYDHVVNNYIAESKSLCKAWVNFDGTTNTGGFCTIRDSYNVTSVADNGTGLYTINFTNPMTNANYSVGSCSRNLSGVSWNLTLPEGGACTTTALQVATGNQSVAGDSPSVSIQIFGS